MEEKQRGRWIIGKALAAAFTLGLFILQVDDISAANQNFVTPDTEIPVVVDFINGDFEEPNLEHVIPPGSFNHNVGTNPTLAQFWGNSAVWLFIPQEEVPGWQAKPINPADNSNPFATIIEIHRKGSGAPSGNQSIDMCGAMNQEFFQTVATTPGTNIYYSYQGRSDPAGMELLFICGDVSNPKNIRTDVMARTWQTYSGVLVAESTQTYFGYRSLNGSESYSNVTYNGVYYPNIKSSGAGALLDNIKFQTPSKIVIEKTILSRQPGEALLGEVITYSIDVTNYGQTDTSGTVLTDVLGDDVEYIGNVKIDGQDAGSLASFNSAADTLTVRLGAGANAAAGGSLKGSVSTGMTEGESVVVTFDVKVTGEIGDKIKNQAAVVYDDKDFEAYTSGGYRDYSNIAEAVIVNGGVYPLQVTKELTSISTEPETFSFRICQYTMDRNSLVKTFYVTVTVPAGSQSESSAINNLYAGYYEIEEIDSNWQYDLAAGSDRKLETTVRDPYIASDMVFINESAGGSWVSNKYELKNKMVQLIP